MGGSITGICISYELCVSSLLFALVIDLNLDVCDINLCRTC